MYELTYIINQNLSEQEVAAQTDRVRGFINGLAGEIKNEKINEKRRLAYPIKNQEYGFYVTTELNIDPEKVSELNKQMRLEQKVIRHILVCKEIIKATPRKIRIPKPGEKVEAVKKITPSETKKVKMEEIDKKLEEILEQ